MEVAAGGACRDGEMMLCLVPAVRSVKALAESQMSEMTFVGARVYLHTRTSPDYSVFYDVSHGGGTKKFYVAAASSSQ